MDNTKNAKLAIKARLLRMFMKKEERGLWENLDKLLPYEVRQKTVIGSYIVDCYIPEAKLVILLGQQDDSNRAANAARGKYLRSMGLTVLQYSHEELKKDSLLIITKILNRIPS